MPSSSFNEQQISSTRDIITSLLGIQLSDAQIEALMSGETLPFQELTQGGDLSEIGTTLIRADALLRSNQGAAKPECNPGCFRLAHPVGSTCICVNRKTLEFSLHEH